MNQTITLTIEHPTQRSGPMNGFRFLWAYLVSGYRSDRHCQRCFYGKLVPELSPTSDSVGVPIQLALSERHPFAYVCGVSAGPTSERAVRNLHLPLRYEEGQTVTMPTYNGYTLIASNAGLVAVTSLPDNWKGLERGHARCKNFQFAVSAFGYPSTPRRGWPEPPAG